MRQIKIDQKMTPRDQDGIKRYLEEIGKIERIDPQEEVRLAVRIKQGDREALDRLVKANLRFVVSVAKKYQNQGMSLPDLINEGNLGLVKAAEVFDETRGFKFISYAVWWIRQSIIMALTLKSRIIRIPPNKMVLSNKLQKTYRYLEQQFERTPSVDEIAEFLEVEPREVEVNLNLTDRHVSLDAPLSEHEESNSMLDETEDPNIDPPDVKIMKESLFKDLKISLNQVTKREREIIFLLFGIGIDYPMSADAIADKYGRTSAWVQGIKSRAIRKLRKNEEKSCLLRKYM